MAKIAKALHEYIDTAFPDNVCLVCTVLPSGYAQVAPRGSVHVYDDQTLAMWDRGNHDSSELLEDGSKVTVYYRNRELGARGGNGLLPIGGIARFYGVAEVHKYGDVRDAIYNGMVQAERDSDAEKKGFGILIKIERAEFLGGKPIPEDLTPKT